MLPGCAFLVMPRSPGLQSGHADFIMSRTDANLDLALGALHVFNPQDGRRTGA